MTSPDHDDYSGDFERSIEGRFLILRGQFVALANDCQRSSESQGERLGRIEQDLRAYREAIDHVKSRQETIEIKLTTMESRLVGALAVLTGAVGIVELLRQIL